MLNNIKQYRVCLFTALLLWPSLSWRRWSVRETDALADSLCCITSTDTGGMLNSVRANCKFAWISIWGPKNFIRDCFTLQTYPGVHGDTNGIRLLHKCHWTRSQFPNALHWVRQLSHKFLDKFALCQQPRPHRQTRRCCFRMLYL